MYTEDTSSVATNTCSALAKALGDIPGISVLFYAVNGSGCIEVHILGEVSIYGTDQKGLDARAVARLLAVVMDTIEDGWDVLLTGGGHTDPARMIVIATEL